MEFLSCVWCCGEKAGEWAVTGGGDLGGGNEEVVCYNHSLCSDACMALLLHRKIFFPCGSRTSLKFATQLGIFLTRIQDIAF